jgi:hypothetical protein
MVERVLPQAAARQLERIQPVGLDVEHGKAVAGVDVEPHGEFIVGNTEALDDEIFEEPDEMESEFAS